MTITRPHAAARFAFALLLLGCAAAPARAQDPGGQDESALHAALDRERGQLSESCAGFSVSKIGSCVYTLATATPLHVSFGSIAPQNGVGFGPAWVWHHTPNENWRINWSADTVRSFGGAWRAGAYANFVRTKVQAPVVVFGDQPPRPAAPDVYPVFSIFAQAIALPTLRFYGISSSGDGAHDAPMTPVAGESRLSAWQMRQTIAGGSALVPVGPGAAGLSVAGAAAVRQVEASGSSDGDVPGIADINAPGAVPGLGDDRTFVQFTAGVVATPGFGAYVRPLYRASVDRFMTGSGAGESFTRWTVDLLHEFPIYRTGAPSASGAMPGIASSPATPNGCPTIDGACPAPSRGRYGAVALRVRAIGSRADGGHRVPFYFQPTLGGSDVNGTPSLSSYSDSFFRAPNVLLAQASIEHSLVAIPLGHGFALPLGAFAMLEAGHADTRFGSLFDRFARSYSAGLTIRAGGFPEVFLVYAWGGGNNHFSATINTSLLGGSSRPSLF
jgi:hypothetical protein